MQQIICTIKIRRAPTRHDTIDFQPLITKTSEILPLLVVIGDKGYDSEDNHVLVRDILDGFSVIPPRYEHVPIRRTDGRYRKTNEAWLFPNCCTVNGTRMKLYFQ